MYYLHKFCVICLKNEKKLKNIFQTDDNGISYYEKLITSISEMVSIIKTTRNINATENLFILYDHLI